MEGMGILGKSNVRKDVFIKHNIPRDEKFVGVKIINPPPMFTKGIANKNTFATTRLKFIRIRE